jgi:murein DD-endopeptidase MepM/ murein hydrolase activator NlpD
MKKFCSIFIIIFLLLGFFITLPSSVQSQPTLQDQIDQLEEKKKKEEKAQEDLKQTIAKERQKVENLQHQKDDLTVELSDLEQEIANIQDEITQLRSEEEFLKNTYLTTEQEIDVLEESIRLKENQLDGLINALYKDYCSRYNKYLFSSTNINEIREFFSELKKTKKILAGKKDALIKDQIRLLEVKKEIEQKSDDLENARNRKDQEIQNIQYMASYSQEVVQKSLQALEESESAVQYFITKIVELHRKKALQNKKMGALIWPIQGVVSSEFGMRMHPIFGVYRMHTGIDIDQQYGYPIKAVDEGTVAFSGWLTGYGNCVIIQHDLEYSTLYAHMNSRYATKDQQVVQGEIIGEVGSTGWSTGPHLHFEVRKNGDYVNPRDYLP